MKITSLLLLTGAVLGGVALAKRLSPETKQKAKDLFRKKFLTKLPLSVQNEL